MESFDDMLTTNPFGNLVTDANYASLQDENYNINLLLFQALLKDFVIQQRNYFFTPPYEVSSVTGTGSSARKRQKGNTTKVTSVTMTKDLSRRTSAEKRENATNSARKLETPGDESLSRTRVQVSGALTTGASSTSSTKVKQSTGTTSPRSTSLFLYHPPPIHSSMKTAEELEKTDTRRKKDPGTN